MYQYILFILWFRFGLDIIAGTRKSLEKIDSGLQVECIHDEMLP
jgi:hypothetical protein